MRTYVDYLMLDKDDITKVCGVISSKEILKEMTSSKFRSLLVNGKLFRGKYILVEKDHNNEDEKFKDAKFVENKKKVYYASADGKFFTIDKKTKEKCYLTKYLHHGFVTIKANQKEYRAKNLVAQMFLGAKRGDNVIYKNDDIFDCSVENLIVIPLRKHLAQQRKKSARNIGLYENDELIKEWNCVSECAEELHYSTRAINSMLNGVNKTKIYDLRFMEG